MEPQSSEYLDGCVGKVVSAAIMDVPDLPKEAEGMGRRKRAGTGDALDKAVGRLADNQLRRL